MKFIFLGFISLSVFAQEYIEPYFDGRLYFVDKDSVTLHWDAPTTEPLPEYYKVQEIWVDPSTEVIYDLGTVDHPTSQLKVYRRRAGHFKYRVQSCKISSSTGEELCSDWASSIDPEHAMLAGNGPGAWICYFRLPPPTDIVVE